MLQKPDYLLEVSWEVCNKIGGIHTVLTSKLPALLRNGFDEKIVFIGPDRWKGTGDNPDFTEDRQLFAAWRKQALNEGLNVKVGRWHTNGNPITLLVDITPYYAKKNDLFAQWWEEFGLDSLSGQWDYSEPALFGYVAAMVIESFTRYQLSDRDQVVVQFHEWMTGTGVLYLSKNAPHIATVFTTHATVVGRVLGTTNQPIYEKIQQYNADQLANDYSLTAKHSLEKTAARQADVFTAVSDLCAQECLYFLHKAPHFITPNGFELPVETQTVVSKRHLARRRLLSVAAAVCQIELPDDALIIATGGRYETQNKGYDVFIAALKALAKMPLTRTVVAFLFVPAPNTGPRRDIINALLSGEKKEITLQEFLLTHLLPDAAQDEMLQLLAQNGFAQNENEKVKIIFAPTYLNGYDGIFNMPYYDLFSGIDLSVFASYYEPWGYTPLESLAMGVPTVTTDLSGFGQWLHTKTGNIEHGIYILPRGGQHEANITHKLAQTVLDFSQKNKEQQQQERDAAHSLAQIALWDKLVHHYWQSYDQALKIAAKRTELLPAHRQGRQHTVQNTLPQSTQPLFKRLLVQAQLPNKLLPLKYLSENLWWAWHHDAVNLFRSIKPELWAETEQNPIALIDQLGIADYNRLQNDAEFMQKLTQVYERFCNYMNPQIPPKEQATQPLVAYFCMEYGLHQSVKLYSGGLGILAGDYLKEVSDCNTPLVAVGLLYRYGYFRQALSPGGEQLAIYEPQRFSHLPLLPVKDEQGNWIKIAIALPGRTLYAKIWLLNVGRVKLYLLDSEVTENNEADRAITHHLYGGDNEMRLKQEILLGIGGIRMLQTLGIQPNVYHCNEGHAAFIGIERLCYEVQAKQLSFDEAVTVVRASSLYTTHTPVPAGHDAFPEDLMRMYFSTYDEMLGIGWQRFMGLGRVLESNEKEKFSMSKLAVRLSQGINGVSKIHGEVSRQMFAELYTGFQADELPVQHITNGVHYPTWIAKQMHDLYKKYLDKDFVDDQANPELWKGIYAIPDRELFETHQSLKQNLMRFIQQKTKTDLTRRHNDPRLQFEIVRQWQPDMLTIGFARRFATYKRATLLFHDPIKLAQLLNDSLRPVRLVFAGKAHPADRGGQEFIRQIVLLSEKPEFAGKIVFLENYDIEVARLLVQGVDVWLNNPTRPLEASGTSGMKAVMNGVMNLSVLDGWWAEGYLPEAGWALPEQNTYDNPDFQNELDAQTIYNLIENELVPLYYHRDANGLPTQWIERMKHCIARIAPHFTMKRMLDEYIARYYTPLYERSNRLSARNYRIAKSFTTWKRKITHHWNDVQLIDMQVYDSTNHPLPVGENFTAKIVLDLHSLSPEDVSVQVVFIRKKTESQYELVQTETLPISQQDNKMVVYECHLPIVASGVYEYGFRMVPNHPDMPNAQELNLVRWFGV